MNDLDALKSEKQRIDAAIRAYPTPIAGCDAEYNYLLERRREIADILADPQPPGDAGA